jgi:hypothetical protein
MEQKDGTITKARQMETMAVFALVFLLIRLKSSHQVFEYLAIASLVIALFVPPLARIITTVWLKLSQLLGHVSNRVILTIIFYLFLTPLAFLYRLFTKNPLRQSSKESGSYYCDRNHTFSKADLEKLW